MIRREQTPAMLVDGLPRIRDLSWSIIVSPEKGPVVGVDTKEFIRNDILAGSFFREFIGAINQGQRELWNIYTSWGIIGFSLKQGVFPRNCAPWRQSRLPDA
jgi:hypothetical protein